MTPQEIQSGLNQFTGTEQWHRLYPGFLITDGVKWLFDQCSSYWIGDILWSYQKKCSKDPSLKYMQFWTLKVDLKKKTAVIICERDTDDVAFSQKIPYTDFPLTEVKIWVEMGEGNMVAELPSEH